LHFWTDDLKDLAKAIRSSKVDTSLVSKVPFYPKGRALVDAAADWHRKGDISCTALRAFSTACEQLAMASEDFCTGAAMQAVDDMINASMMMKDGHTDQLQKMMLAIVPVVVSHFIRVGVARFLAHVGPALRGEVEHAAWIEQAAAERADLMSWINLSAQLLAVTTVATFLPDAPVRLASVLRMSNILDLLVKLPAMVAADVAPAEAIRIQKAISSSFTLGDHANVLGMDLASWLTTFKSKCDLLSSGGAAEKLRRALEPRVQSLFSRILKLLSEPFFTKATVGDDVLGFRR
jgi:hypothetical protein